MKRHTDVPTTLLVEEVLRQCDDFMSYDMLVKATGRDYHQVHAACFSLRKYRVVDVVVEANGVGWWFALPKEEDTRIWRKKTSTLGREIPNRKPRVEVKRGPFIRSNRSK